MRSFCENPSTTEVQQQEKDYKREREAKVEADAFRVCFAQNRQQTDKQNKLFSKITSALSLARTKTGVPIKVSKATNPLLGR